MKSISGKDLCRIVERHGWELRRIHGSHYIYGRQGSIVRLSISVHGTQSVKPGLLRHLLKLADIAEDDDL